jgi:hypothetical protein
MPREVVAACVSTRPSGGARDRPAGGGCPPRVPCVCARPGALLGHPLRAGCRPRALRCCGGTAYAVPVAGPQAYQVAVTQAQTLITMTSAP